jgi:hypothetical protein
VKREVKQAVAARLIEAAGDLIEGWDERYASVGEEPPCTYEEARKCIALWLHKLPGDSWDMRLGDID